MNRPAGTAQTAKAGRPAAQAQPRAAQPKPKPKDNKPPETIDLSDDDDEDDKDRWEIHFDPFWSILFHFDSFWSILNRFVPVWTPQNINPEYPVLIGQKSSLISLMHFGQIQKRNKPVDYKVIFGNF